MADANRLGSTEAHSGGKPNSQQVGQGVIPNRPTEMENHKAEETANSKVGSPTEYGGTFRRHVFKRAANSRRGGLVDPRVH
jgi:hypothetical protein